MHEQRAADDFITPKVDMYCMDKYRDTYTFFWGSNDEEHLQLIAPTMGEGKSAKRTRVLRVRDSLEVIDQAWQGACVEGVCTLIPRKEAIGRRVLGMDGAIWDDLFQALLVLEKDKGKSARKVGKARAVVCDGDGSKYVTVGSSPCQRRKGITSTLKILNRPEHSKHKEVIGRWMRRVEHCATKYLPVQAREIVKAVRMYCNHEGIDCSNGKRSTLFPALAMGRNAFLNVHVDSDFNFSLAAVYARTLPEVDGPIVCYFCFPTLGIAVALRNGDMLLFNSKVPHCVSSRCNRKEDAFCISMYTKTLLVGGNDNDQVLNQEELDAAKEVDEKFAYVSSETGTRKETDGVQS